MWHFNVFTTYFWRHLWSTIEHMHSDVESINFVLKWMAYPTLLGWHQTRYADVMYTSFQSCDNSSFSYNSWMPTMDAWLLQTPWLWRLSSYGADAGFTFFFHNIRFWYSVNPVGDTGDGRGTRQFGVHDGDSGWLLEKVNKIFFYLHIYIQMYLFVISSHYGLCSGVPTGTKN